MKITKVVDVTGEDTPTAIEVTLRISAHDWPSDHPMRTEAAFKSELQKLVARAWTITVD